MPRRLAVAVSLAAAALALVLLRLPFLSVPLERDEGEYAYIAQRLLHGEMPYRDAFDQKPPGTFFAYAAALALLGPSVESIRWLLMAWSAATALALFVLVRRLADAGAAALAALVFAVASADPVLAATAANTELFLLLPMTGSLAAALRGWDGDRPWAWLAAGALAAAACWFKPVAASSAVLLGVLASTRRAGRGRALMALGLGALACSLPILAGLRATGSWEPFVEAVVIHNAAYARSLSPVQSASNLLGQLGRQAPSFGIFWALAGFALLRRSGASRRARWLLGGWGLACFLGLAAGRFFRPHYFVQWLPPLCALAGLGAAALLRPALARGRAAAAAALVGLLALLVAPPVAARWATLTAGSPEAIARRIYGMNPFPEAVRLGAFVRQATRPDETVLVVGSEPEILFYAGRRSATRFIFFYPLASEVPGAPARQREALREVRGNRPGSVVWINLDASLRIGPSDGSPLLDALADLLEREYRLELLARPQSGEPAYVFSMGAAARHVAREAGRDWREQPWLAVYRRLSQPSS